jgi:hypothetical protein
VTEAEWLTCDNLSEMLRWLEPRVGPRKLRLFACACCRQNWDDLTDGRYRVAIETAECLADGRVSEADREVASLGLTQAAEALWDAGGELRPSLIPYWLLAADFQVRDAEYCSWLMAELDGQSILCRNESVDPEGYRGTLLGRELGYQMGFPSESSREVEADMRFEQAQFVRDLWGNLFRAVRVDPRWRTADAVGLARGIYEDRAFDRLPILADALIEAGCDDESILGHCRGHGPHVRGCWVVDLVLGKE